MMKKSSIEQIEYELTTFIRRAVYLDTSDRKIGHLERAPYLLLRELDEVGATRVKELAASFKLDISTLSRQAAALEERKFITRSSDPTDRRVSLLMITEKGKEALEKDKRLRIERYESMLKGWSEEDKETFGILISRMNDVFFE
ncbi:MarR family winged helix-turn-helix transcriptional regulator [Priestia koreensis]|uniref:MarR family transcriptional regulator n=1 Tax=Priestia koreensis TaxID=284581 RepID=A0A0M0L4I5_9BACI|nr:MarR family transcriptional regulator [Priestia koreensis]KOO45975.1 MarR family transcriptional regulator [Priestia koreensis]MCM3006510.1 MarR family transcriptional regulator [Priestia koreensis]